MATAQYKVFTATEARIVVAIGRTILPSSAKGLDSDDARAVEYIDGFLSRIEPFERTQLRGMFMLFELGYAAWAKELQGRFTKATPKKRTAYLDSWQYHRSYGRRMLFQALRSMYVMAYFGSDEVARDLGVTHGELRDRDPIPLLKQLASLAVDLDRAPTQAEVDADAAAAAAPGEAADNVEMDVEESPSTATVTEMRPLPTPLPPSQGHYLFSHESLFEFGDYGSDIVDTCDVVVVGSGPGGAIAARKLIQQGLDVVVVEAGPVVRREEFARDIGHSLSNYYWDSGLRTTRGNVIIPTMQPRCLGGGSVYNSAICMRAADYALERWSWENGVHGLGKDDLAPHFDEVEEFMGVRPVQADVQGPRNELFRQACDSVGISCETIRRNEIGCRGSGRCNAGCPNGAKLSTDLRGIPEILEAGARVYTCCYVDRVLTSGSQMRGVTGVVVDPVTKKKSINVKVFAKSVVLAAGTLATPAIAQRSGMTADPIGSNLRFHPATVVTGNFPDGVFPWYGAAQGYHSLDMMNEGIKLESLWADAALMAFRVPGMGRNLKRQLQKYRNSCTWDSWVSGDSSVGRVRSVPGTMRSSYTFDLGRGDIRRLVQATITLSEMFFAVGAKTVLPGINGMPEMLRRPADIDQLRGADVDPKDLPVGSNHTYGTMPMGDDPDRAATDSNGLVYGTDNLYVADTSLFPSTPGANPMLTGMALANRIGGIVADRT